MPTARTEVHSILLTTSMDSACSAAALVLVHGDCQMEITSQNRIASTLRKQLTLSPAPTQVHVCGVGVVDLAAVFEQLQLLRGEGVTVRWYCGRGYLDELRTELEKVCEVVFEKAQTNTEAVLKHTKLSKHERTPLLRALAREYVERKPAKGKANELFHALVKRGCYYYLQSGEAELLSRTVRQLAGTLPLGGETEERELARFMGDEKKRPTLGHSKAMSELKKRIKTMAPLSEAVLVLGPSGAGKELVAQALHELSPRKQEPFVPINCAILSTSSELAYDRLFGHVHGAYTGTQGDTKGAFEKADGGTLFLDEVAELPLDVQTQLLRVLEDGTILPQGTMEPRRVNVRIIAATNKNLPALVRLELFREDLYYRLNVLTLDVPPLKAHMEDTRSIATLVQAELRDQGVDYRLSRKDWEAIDAYGWPGNVRQFVNVLKRAALTQRTMSEAMEEEKARRLSSSPMTTTPGDGTPGDGGKLLAEDGSPLTITPADLRLFFPQTQEEIRPEEEIRASYMRHVLGLCEGNQTQAAAALGISPNTLRKYVK